MTLSDFQPKGPPDGTCTQVTTGVCSSEFLASVLADHHGVMIAYCNDKFLIVSATGEIGPKFDSNLNDIPFPPGKADTNYVTGQDTRAYVQAQSLYYPLGVTDLSTSSGSVNNIDVFDVTTGIGAYSYLIKSATNTPYSLPSDNGVGMAVNGQPIFPVYNNNAGFTTPKCEVDRCNLHVGQGGGSPHFHGDMFGDDAEGGTTCLYGPSDYANGATGHPPVVGFSYDGHLIYGRYLDDSAPGFAAPLLDACGGHSHDVTGTDENGISLQEYHYHTQIFDATVEAGSIADTNEAYVVSTPGPYQCWKADLTQSAGSSALQAATADADGQYSTQNAMSYRCSGMTGELCCMPS